MTTADIHAVAAQAALDNIQRQGLAWRLVPGTVVTPGITGVNVIIDGDDLPITAQSLIGVVATGQRIMIIDVPPQGKYIVGWYGPNPLYQAGSVSFNLVAVASATQAVTFDHPYDAPPSVTTSISSGSGLLTNWQSRAISVTTTGFTIFIYGPAAATTTAPVNWQAQPTTQ